MSQMALTLLIGAFVIVQALVFILLLVVIMKNIIRG